MQTLTEIRQLLAEHDLRPKHRLGQNFLHDKNQLTKLLDAAEIGRGDIVLEVGPGTGTLTSALLERGANVVACEIDDDMAGIVETVFVDAMKRGALRLIKGDALEKARRLNSQVINSIGQHSFKLVANLPYQIASPLITTLLIDHASQCSGQFVTIQKEVADRLIARPSTKEYGPLSIIVQAFAEVKKIGTLSPTCFWPPPEVTSAMVAIVPNESGIQPDDRRAFARFITQLFTKRRKQLGAILGREVVNWPAGVSSEQRPEALDIAQWIELWRLHGYWAE